jgi:Na+/H+-dicarboxylate symporter
MRKHVLIGLLVGIPATILYLFLRFGDDVFIYFWFHTFPPSVIIGLSAGLLGNFLDKKLAAKEDKSIFRLLLTPIIAIVFSILFSKILAMIFVGIFWPGF